MTCDELQQLNELKKEIDVLRDKFSFIESSCSCDKEYDGTNYHGKLALCKVFIRNDICTSRSIHNDKIVAEFDEEMKMAVLQVLHSRLSILENKFNSLSVNEREG